MTDIKKQVAALTEELLCDNYLYHELNMPVKSDLEYDEAYRRLVALEQQYPEYALPYSPTKRVGWAPQSKFQKAEHTVPMLSLENLFLEYVNGKLVCNGLQEYLDMVNKTLGVDHVDFAVEVKYDGVSIDLQYVDGILIQALTRGNGVEGENVTNNAYRIHRIPTTLPKKESLHVRGEVMMDFPDFELLNRNRELAGEQPFSNPRNAAAGSLRQLDPNVTAERNLVFRPYQVVAGKPLGLRTHYEALTNLIDYGFTPTYVPIAETLLEAFEEVLNERNTLRFMIDGVVIKVDNLDLQRALGVSGRSPVWARAIKFPAQSFKSTIRSVEITVGRTGLLTPVLNIDPVNISGVMVSNVTAHTFSKLEELGLRIGSRINVIRSADCIPHLESVIEVGKGELIGEPLSCPTCGSPVYKQGEKSKRVYCSGGVKCNGQKTAMLTQFMLQTNMGKFFVGSNNLPNPVATGPAAIAQYVKDGMLENYSDFFTEAFSDASGVKYDTSVIHSFSDFVTYLGIPDVGPSTAEVLTHQFTDIESLSKATYEELVKLPGIGKATANVVVSYFSNEENMAVINELIKAGVKYGNKGLSTELKDEVFTFTGSFDTMSREEAAAKAKLHGARVASSVGKATTILVCGANAGDKLNKARTMGIRVIDEYEFKQLIKE